MSGRLSGSGINFGSRSFEELEGSQRGDGAHEDRASLLGRPRRMSRGTKGGSPLEEEEGGGGGGGGEHDDDPHAKPPPKQSGSELRARRKVSTFELFKFATFKDILLMILGSIFSVFEGAGPSVMALVFGGMTNTLVTTVQTGFAPDNSPLNATTDATLVAPSASQTASVIPPTTVMAADGGGGQPAEVQFTAAEFESEISKYALYYVFIGLGIYVSSLVQISCWQTSCERQVYRIRRAFFHAIVRQELAWFDKNQSGELSAKFNDDIDRVREGIGEQFSEMIKYLSSFASGFVVGFVVSWRLTLVILAVSPLLALFSAYLGRMLATSTQREQEKYASAGALAEEVLTSVRTVFALNGQRTEIKNYTRRLNEGKRMAFIKYFKLSLMFGASMFVLYSTYGLALYVSTEMLSTGLITPGAAMTVIVAVMFAAGAMGNIVPPFQTIVMAKASANLIYEIIESVPRIDALSDRGLKLSKVTANIKFENVTFAYPLRKSTPVIRSLSLEVNQGQTVAICGRTGSGKSTVMNLLLRFYDPQEGAVYLDNCNLCDLNVAWLRSLVGIVEQEPALFDCSIYENIALGAIQESDRAYARIIEAAKLANAHDFIANLPDGYNTRCGDRGVQLSGGQKQRISIARALLSDPKLLLLDEATSALDSESEFMVQSALNKARQGRTTIIIAHRLSTIRDADLICVMESGVIVEQGRHEELMAKKGAYHDLVTNQVFTDESGEQAGEQVVVGKDGAAAAAAAGAASGDGKDPATSRLGVDSDSAAEDAGQQDREGDDGLGQARKRKTFTFRALKSDAGGDDDESSSLLSSEAQAARGGGGRELSLASGRAASSTGASKKLAGGASTTMYESINRPIKSLVEFQKEQTDEVVLPKFGDIIRLIRPELPRYGFSILAAIVAGALLPTFAIFYAQIFDTFTKTGDELMESGEFWSLMFLALAAANFIALFLRITTMSTTIEITLARLRIQCFNTIMRQHVGWFDSANHSPQRLTTRLATDVPQVKAVLNARLANLISGVATITASLIVAFYLGWQLAILLTVALPLLLYMGYLQMKVSRGDQQSYVKRMENASRLATEVFEHVKLVQAINQERYFFEKFSKELQLPLREGLKTARRFGMIYGLSQSIIYFVYGASFRWGAYLMAREILTPTTVYRVFFAISFTAVAVGQWGGLSGNMSRANYAIGLIMRLLSAQPQIDNLSRGGIKPRLQGSISFQDVYFRYPTRPDTQVLQGLCLEVKAGQTLALVGPSGQGKSTIASLLLRFYDPDKGVVRIDNYDIRCINLNHLRQSVGLVSQEPVLFKASIKDNILYGMDKSRFSMREVVQAAKLANIDEFIASLPQKYDTQVGDRGSQMSGGQKQRIAIARTMIRNPTILILDEATSALDAESEALVNQALEKAAKGKTCIKIAHRLSTVRDADQIAVIEQGQIVEIGAHDELMALGKKGHYFRLMQKQDISS